MTVRIAIDGKAVGGVMNGEYGDTEEPSKRADAFLGCRAGEAALEGAGGFFGRLQDEVRVALVRGTEGALGMGCVPEGEQQGKSDDDAYPCDP